MPIKLQERVEELSRLEREHLQSISQLRASVFAQQQALSQHTIEARLQHSSKALERVNATAPRLGDSAPLRATASALAPLHAPSLLPPASPGRLQSPSKRLEQA